MMQKINFFLYSLLFCTIINPVERCFIGFRVFAFDFLLSKTQTVNLEITRLNNQLFSFDKKIFSIRKLFFFCRMSHSIFFAPKNCDNLIHLKIIYSSVKPCKWWLQLLVYNPILSLFKLTMIIFLPRKTDSQKPSKHTKLKTVERVALAFFNYKIVSNSGCFQFGRNKISGKSLVNC